jgi:hypothetical protein
MSFSVSHSTIGHLVIVGLVSGVAISSPAEDTIRTVKGTVTAVNVKASPKVLVVRVFTQENKEMIVGVTVQASATITRGGKPAKLEDLRTGESILLRYVKDASGLAAQSIEAHERP